MVSPIYKIKKYMLYKGINKIKFKEINISKQPTPPFMKIYDKL